MFCSKYARKCSKKEQNSMILEHTSIICIIYLEKPGRLCYYIPCRRDVAQFGRALRSGRKGRRFESCHPDQIKEYTLQGVFFYLLMNRGFEPRGGTAVNERTR